MCFGLIYLFHNLFGFVVENSSFAQYWTMAFYICDSAEVILRMEGDKNCGFKRTEYE